MGVGGSQWGREAGGVDAGRSKPGGSQSPLLAREAPDLTPVSSVSAPSLLAPNVWGYASHQPILQLLGYQLGVLQSTCDINYQSWCRPCRLRASSHSTVPCFRCQGEARPAVLLTSWLRNSGFPLH